MKLTKENLLKIGADENCIEFFKRHHRLSEYSLDELSIYDDYCAHHIDWVRDNLSNECTYDENGNMVMASWKKRQFIEYFTYDHYGNITSCRDSDGGSFKYDYTYDPAGNVLSSCRNNTRYCYYTYDANNNVVSEYTNSNNMTYAYMNDYFKEYYYDPHNNLVLRVDSSEDNGEDSRKYQYTEKYTYDDNGNMLSRVDSDDRYCYYTYDTNNNMTTLKDSNGNFENFTEKLPDGVLHRTRQNGKIVLEIKIK